MAIEVINISQNPNTSDYLAKKIDGKQMRALALKRITMQHRLRITGQAKPATILNFNPCALRLEGGIPYKVPSIVDPAVHDAFKAKFSYAGKTYKATLLTVAEPHIFPWITDVARGEFDDMADGVGVFDAAACKQIEIAFDFWQAYNYGAPDSSDMGGVVCFEGDKNALKIGSINVPVFESLPDGTREYITEPRDFGETLGIALDKQRKYYDRQIQEAQAYWNDPDQRKNIHTMHLVWAQYGLDMGWREKPVDWQLSTNEPEESCEGCGSAKKRATAYFCHACNRPYDPFRCFMDGEIDITSVYMHRITKEEDWEKIHAEEARRKRLREGGTPSTKKAKE